MYTGGGKMDPTSVKTFSPVDESFAKEVISVLTGKCPVFVNED